MNVLAVGCHPDDIEIGCGGTLARYTAEGHHVDMLIVANGDKGHVEIEKSELREIRRSEAEKGAEKLGSSGLFFTDVPDLNVKDIDDGVVREITGIIRKCKPDLIITHAPDDYMTDHRCVSQIVFDASFSASVPHYAEHEAPTGIAPLYYMDTIAGINFNPEEYVDITGYIDIKISALEQHESQIRWLRDHDGIDFSEFVTTVSRFRGIQSNVKYAEAFRLCRSWPRLTARRMLP